MHSPLRSHSSCIQPLPCSCSSPQAREGASETGPRSAQTPGRWASGLRWSRSRLDLSQSGRAAIASPNANGSATTKADRGSDPAPHPRRLRHNGSRGCWSASRCRHHRINNNTDRQKLRLREEGKRWMGGGGRPVHYGTCRLRMKCASTTHNFWTKLSRQRLNKHDIFFFFDYIFIIIIIYNCI